MKYLKIGQSKNYVVFLHGWGADKNSFLWVSNYIKNRSLIFVDFAGFGESDEPEKSYSVFDYVQDLKLILDEFEIESIVFVGHSFGGRVAIKFLSLYQYKYNNVKLCLIDSAGLIPRRNLIYYCRICRFKFYKKIAKYCKSIEKNILKMGSNDYKCLSDVMKETFKLVVNEDLSHDAKTIKVPTIIVWGEKDNETKLYMAKKLNRLIIGSSLKIIKDAGHFSFIDKPQEFLIILDTFLKNL